MNKIAAWNDRFSEAKRSFSFGILQYLYDCNLQIHSIFRQIFSPKIKGHSILAMAFHLIIYIGLRGIGGAHRLWASAPPIRRETLFHNNLATAYDVDACGQLVACVV